MRKIWVANVRKYAIVDDEDYDRVSQLKLIGSASKTTIYCRAQHEGKFISIHSMIMGFPERPVYFRDGNGMNLRKSNLSFYRWDITGKMTDDLKAFILGTLLGDASAPINENHGKRRFGLSFIHCDKQVDYIWHKANLLHDYIRKNPRKCLVKPSKLVKKARIAHRLLACVSSDFDFLDMCYDKNNKKHVSKEWVDGLTLSSLAYWYMDDGFLKRNKRATFCTNSFSVTECNRLIRRLKGMGFSSRIVFLHRPGRREPLIEMDYPSSKEFISQIGHMVLDCLKHKTEIVEMEKPKCHFCGDITKGRFYLVSDEIRSCSKPECKKAHRSQSSKEYYEKNSTRICEYQKEYRSENTERCSERSRKWRSENKELARETRKQWEENNKDLIKGYRKKYKNNNRDLLNEKNRKYHAENREEINRKRRESRAKKKLEAG